MRSRGGGGGGLEHEGSDLCSYLGVLKDGSQEWFFLPADNDLVQLYESTHEEFMVNIELMSPKEPRWMYYIFEEEPTN